jgi:uroporphyrinogen decarboxylase
MMEWNKDAGVQPRSLSQKETEMTMNHWERLRTALKGEATDRPPMSFWRHWPRQDETAQGLAEAMVRWQRDFDFDLVKFMPTGTYGVHDWGAETEYGPPAGGTRIVTKPGVTRPDQWPELARLDVGAGSYGREIEAVRLAAQALDGSVPILQTVFSPLTTARKLAGDELFVHMRKQPAEFKAGLAIIAEVTIRFAQECLRAGAHGLFFASQCTTYGTMSEAEYREFGQHYDLMVLNAVKREAEFTMFHAHGEEILFDLVAQTYPVEMINWHDRITWPSLREAQERFGGLLVGGVNDRTTLLNGPVAAIQAEVRDAIAQTGGRRLVVGPSCVIPTTTPVEHVRAAIEAVRGAG